MLITYRTLREAAALVHVCQAALAAALPWIRIKQAGVRLVRRLLELLPPPKEAGDYDLF